MATTTSLVSTGRSMASGSGETRWARLPIEEAAAAASLDTRAGGGRDGRSVRSQETVAASLRPQRAPVAAGTLGACSGGWLPAGGMTRIQLSFLQRFFTFSGQYHSPIAVSATLTSTLHYSSALGGGASPKRRGAFCRKSENRSGENYVPAARCGRLPRATQVAGRRRERYIAGAGWALARDLPRRSTESVNS